MSNPMFDRCTIILLFSTLLISCEKNDIDPLYPTVINKLNTTILAQKKTDFHEKYQYMFSSINEFGFCGSTINYYPGQAPVLEPLIQTEAIAILKDFITQNPSETGVENPDDITFERINFNSGLYKGRTTWHIRTNPQKVDTIEVMYSGISFFITNRELETCTGNWFPEIYIPKAFKFNQEKAKLILNNHLVSHYSIIGQVSYVKITTDDLDKSAVKLVIYPKRTDDKIELRVVWQINIPAPVFYIIYVDVMTGEIIEEPTAIAFDKSTKLNI